MSSSTEVSPTFWSRTLRWILLITFFPLLGATIWHVVNFDAAIVTGMHFSPDGRQLLVFRWLRGDPSTFKVEVWDIASSRLSRVHKTGHGELRGTLGGRYVLDWRDLRIRLLNSSTFEPVQSADWQ